MPGGEIDVSIRDISDNQIATRLEADYADGIAKAWVP